MNDLLNITKDNNTFEITRRKRETFCCASIKECIPKLPTDILEKIALAENYLYKGEVMDGTPMEDICWYDAFGNKSEPVISVDTVTLLQMIFDLRLEVGILKETLGYVPGGPVYEKAKDRFEKDSKQR